MKPTFFATPEAFRKWLDQHHQNAKELLVGFHKKGTEKPSITWPESVDQALCYGWIDGVRKRLDEESYTIRFSPRRPQSAWSTVNLKRVAVLKKLGLMKQAGLDAFGKRSEEKNRKYAYEQRYAAKLDPVLLKQFKTNKKAWVYFQSQAPWYQRTTTHWITSAQKEETKRRRLSTLMAACAEGRRMI